ncbi:MAG: hypothetical protein ABUS56_13020 [Acidobacteriota bacterium]
MSMMIVGWLLAGQLATSQVQPPAPPPAAPTVGSRDPVMSVPQAPAAQPTPEDYLRVAQGILETLPASGVSREAHDAVAKLRTAFEALARTYAATPDAPIAAPGAVLTPQQDWKLRFDDVERALTAILGGGSSLNAMSLEALAAFDIGVPNLDPVLRRQLDMLRENVELFYVTATALGHGHTLLPVPAGR